MTHGFHPPSEEYLEAVLELDEDGVEVIQARLAERLGHSAPTVSETVRRLRDEGFVTVTGRRVALTDKGRKKAESVMRKHRLAECLLVNIIGLPWQKCHDEATRWEHVISDEVEGRLIDVLGNPAVCPHGNPIPGAVDNAPVAATLSLLDVDPGTDVQLLRVSEQAQFDEAALAFLAHNELLPGAVITRGDLKRNGSVIVNRAGIAIPVDAKLAGRLFVTAV